MGMIPMEIATDQDSESRTMFNRAPQTRGNTSIFKGIARRTLGIFLLLMVVVLWTTSNFLASVCTYMDNSYEHIFTPFPSFVQR
jgi:hypothetical protein